MANETNEGMIDMKILVTGSGFIGSNLSVYCEVRKLK